MLGVLAGALWALTPEQRTEQALQMILAGKFQEFYALFSPEMKKAITQDTYASQVGQILTSLGRPESQDAPQVQRVGDGTTVTIPVHWKAASLNFIVSWNAAGEIQGTWFRPGQSKAANAYQTAPYSKPDSFSAREVSFGTEGQKLPGTLTVPKGAGPWPAVVLVHGSGPQRTR